MFLLFILFGIEKILAVRDCRITLPKNYNNGKIYTNVFQWKKPVDSFGGTKDCVQHGDIIRFTCENGFVKEDFISNSYVFECTDGKFNETLVYDDLLCKSDFHRNTRVERVPDIMLRSRVFKCNGNGLEVYRVSARREDGTCKELYRVCFDRNVMRTKFVFQPPGTEVAKKSNESRRDVWGLDYFGSNAWEKLKLSNGYVSRIQKMRITAAMPSRYNKKKKYPYSFNRGHLAPYADFVETDDKKASCEYLNVAPQWREFNGNSWSVVERMTRELIGNDAADWEIYTGTYGNIPTERGPLFLSAFFDERGKFIKAFVPVPKLYWKVVFNRSYRNDSRVFVGVNNPELKSPEQFGGGYVICQPKRLRKNNFFLGSEFKGFTYECDVEEFLSRLAKDENIIKENELLHME